MSEPMTNPETGLPETQEEREARLREAETVLDAKNQDQKKGRDKS